MPGFSALGELALGEGGPQGSVAYQEDNTLVSAVTVAVAAGASITQADDALASTAGVLGVASAAIVQDGNTLVSLAAVHLVAAATLTQQPDSVASEALATAGLSAAIVQDDNGLLAEATSNVLLASLIQEDDTLAAFVTSNALRAAMVQEGDALSATAIATLTAFVSVVQDSMTLIGSMRTPISIRNMAGSLVDTEGTGTLTKRSMAGTLN
jgi:hypothetical protein